MRVALVLASSTGGIGRHVASLASGLHESGHDLTVYGPAAAEEQFAFTRLGAAFQPVEIPARPRPADAAAVRELRRALRLQQPAVIHAHSLRAGVVAALARSGALRPEGTSRAKTVLPLVVTWHNLMLADGLRARVYRPLERYLARATTVTLCASGDLVERARELGAKDVRLAAVAAPVLPPPVRAAQEVREELGLVAGQPLVLSVGRLHPQKGYDVLVSAAARWRDRAPRPMVAIAGSGPAYMDLAARISAARAPVTLLGHRNDVAELLEAADLAVVTSVWEARQLFAQEALRAAVPLVATRVGGIPDLVGDAAVLIQPHDVDAVDRAVRELLDDPERRRDLSERARRQAATWPTEDDTLRQVLEVYAELAPEPAQ
jgi:glycosyltransferase involved in cell wall biosynthesis